MQILSFCKRVDCVNQHFVMWLFGQKIFFLMTSLLGFPILNHKIRQFQIIFKSQKFLYGFTSQPPDHESLLCCGFALCLGTFLLITHLLSYS